MEHLLQHRRELAVWIDMALRSPPDELAWERGPTGFLRVRLAHWLWRKNQFLRVDGQALREIDELYRRSLRHAA